MSPSDFGAVTPKFFFIEMSTIPIFRKVKCRKITVEYASLRVLSKLERKRKEEMNIAEGKPVRSGMDKTRKPGALKMIIIHIPAPLEDTLFSHIISIDMNLEINEIS